MNKLILDMQTSKNKKIDFNYQQSSKSKSNSKSKSKSNSKSRSNSNESDKDVVLLDSIKLDPKLKKQNTNQNQGKKNLEKKISNADRRISRGVVGKSSHDI